jgi:hypothetical protein
MRTSTVTVFESLFFVCLTLSRFCGPAAAIEHNVATCAGEKITQGPNGTFGCQVPLPARPPGSKGGAGPNEWGMCGVLSLSGFFNQGTAAQIVVGSNGYYAVDLKYTSANDTAAKHWPELGWTCVFLHEFTHVPGIMDASFFVPSAYSGGSSTNISGSKGYACIWAGVSGGLTEIDKDVAYSAGGSAYAQFRSPLTAIGAFNDTSYAFCTGYKTSSWSGWKYSLNRSVGFHTAPQTLTLNKSNYWCYMDGVIASWDLQNGGTAFPGPIHPAINISSSGAYSFDGVWDNMAEAPAYVGLSINCLPLAQ